MREQPLSFEGEEVSCRIVGFFLDRLEERRLPPEILTAGTDAKPEQLRDRRQRISWQTFQGIAANLSRVWNDEELAALGGALVQSSRLRFFALLTRLFYSAADVYKTVSELTHSAGFVDFTCVDNSFLRLGPDHVRIDVTMEEGYEPCREFFVVTEGMFRAVPEAIGLAAAEVERSELPGGGARYDIRVPSGGGLLRWLRKVTTEPFRLVRTVRELQAANKQLYVRYGKLQAEIAERRRVEAALRQREDQFRRLVENSPYSICHISREGDLEEINAAGLAMLDLTSNDDVRGRPFLDFVASEHRQYVSQLVEHGLMGGTPGFHFKATNGRLLQTVLVPVSGEEIRPMPLMGLTLDVTDRERAQEELRSYAREMAVLNQMMAQGADAGSVQSLLAGVVSSVCERLGFDAGAVYTLRPSPPSSQGAPDERVAELRYAAPKEGAAALLPSDKAPYSLVFVRGRAVTSLGDPRILTGEEKAAGNVLAALVPILWGQKVLGAFRFAVRGSERRSRVDLPASSGDRVRTLSALGQQLGAFLARLQAEEDRKRLILELEEKNAELERFTYTVSHDLKNPLFTINGYLGFLERDTEIGDLERIAADLGPIKSAVGKMQQLLDDLVDLTRIGRVANTPQRVALAELAEEAVSLVAGQVEERGAEVLISPRLPVVEGDRPRLLEVFQNLIGNAVKYLGEQNAPRIEISLTERDGEPLCYVRDNGIGIEPRYHDKVFDLFDQLDPEREGTGVGLALVKRIVEQYGGKIWVESEGLGKGTTFYFTLPESASLLAHKMAAGLK